MSLLSKLDPGENELVDGENNPIRLDTAYGVKGNNLFDAVEELRRVHGDDTRLLPMSGRSSGGGVFQVENPGVRPIIGLLFPPTPKPNISRSGNVDITTVGLDQIIIDESAGQVCAGSSITLDQLNRALAEELGARFRVLGADLTSYVYAQVGATFMTGGMGPQRRYFSDSVNEIGLYDGHGVWRIEGAELNAYAGTYGWSGLVSAVSCDFKELPRNEIAFAIPVNNSADSLARVLGCFSPYTHLSVESGRVRTTDGGTDLILGVEHITRASMGPMFNRSADSDIAKRAAQLSDICNEAGADGLLFVNGFSNLPVEEFLFRLVGDEAEMPSIGGVGLEHAEIFKDPEQMRAVREGVPAAARTQSPGGKYVHKGHTDANVRLNPQCVEQTMVRLWQANQDYVAAMQSCFDSTPGLRGGDPGLRSPQSGRGGPTQSPDFCLRRRKDLSSYLRIGPRAT